MDEGGGVGGGQTGSYDHYTKYAVHSGSKVLSKNPRYLKPKICTTIDTYMQFVNTGMNYLHAERVFKVIIITLKGICVLSPTKTKTRNKIHDETILYFDCGCYVSKKGPRAQEFPVVFPKYFVQ